MALTYITKAAEAASRRNQQTATMIQQITKRAADKQAAKNARADAVVKEGRQYGNDFYELYDAQEKSGTVSWNAGASELVGKLAGEQEELYSKAFGSNGTPELRNEFRVKQSRDKQVLSSIGQWATLSNQNAKAMSLYLTVLFCQHTGINSITQFLAWLEVRHVLPAQSYWCSGLWVSPNAWNAIVQRETAKTSNLYSFAVR